MPHIPHLPDVGVARLYICPFLVAVQNSVCKSPPMGQEILGGLIGPPFLVGRRARKT